MVEAVGGVEDASSAAGNLGVAEALYLVDELTLAAARIDNVGVGVAEGWQDGASLGIEDLSAWLEVGCAVGEGAPGADLLIGNEEPGVGKNLETSHLGPLQAGQALVDTCKGAYVGDEQTVHSGLCVRRNWMECSMCGYMSSSLRMKGTTLR